ncbi:MAG TPA: hypothetical protein VFA92_10450 [Candidatus Binatia bacterium]|nr:hypothetical protein [Candidatus Binatia bacterium]
MSDSKDPVEARLRQARELSDAIASELAEMVTEIEALRGREGAPPDVEEFLETAHDTLTRLAEQARPNGSTADTPI